MNRSRHRTLGSLVSAAAIAVGLVVGLGPAAQSSASAAKSPLVLELDWVPNPDHSALYYALEKGYFSRAGLDVTFEVPSDATVPNKLVALDKVDLAVSYEDEQFFSEEQGLNDIAVEAMIPQPLDSIIIPAKEHVTKLSQLKGMTLGSDGGDVDTAFAAYFMKREGWASSQVKWINVGESLVPSVLSGKVDGIIGGYRNVEAIQIGQEQGAKPTVFPVNDLGVPNYDELVVIANSLRLSSDPGYARAVKKFVGALVAATKAAQSATAAATAIMNQETQYTKQFDAVSVPLTLRLMTPPDGSRIGCMNLANWQSFGDWLKSAKLITDRPKASVVATDKYLPYSC